MNKKIYALVLALLLVASHAMATDGKVSDFERLKQQSTENSIPLVNITVDTSVVTKADYTQGVMEIFDLQARTGGNTTVKMNCKVKYRGSSSLQYEKKSFAIKTLDENMGKANVSIFGIRADDSWILDAMAIDRIRMRNRLCFDLWNEISRTPYDTDYGNRNGTEGVFVEVFINGEYHGLYCMTDKINRKLLDLKKTKENEDGSVSVRGILYKGYSWCKATSLWGYDNTQPFDTDVWNGWELQYPDDYPSADTWRPLMDFIDVFQLSDDSFATVYDKHVYTDNLISYAILILATNYGDCMMKNTFLSVPNIAKSTKFLVTPWDMDMSLGGYYNGEYYNVLADYSTLEDSKLFGALLRRNIDSFKDSLTARWGVLRNTVFSPESVNRRIDDYSELFTESGAWQREQEKWNGNPVELNEDIASEADYVKNWYQRNYQSVCSIFGMEAGIKDVPTGGNRIGTTSIYTLDGRKCDGRSRRGIVIENGRKVLRKR